MKLATRTLVLTLLVSLLLWFLFTVSFQVPLTEGGTAVIVGFSLLAVTLLQTLISLFRHWYSKRPEQRKT